MDNKEMLPPFLRAEILRVSKLVQDAEWYLFGSLLQAQQQAIDIDILILYRSDDTAEMIRDELREVTLRFPVHLLFLSEHEEAELDFIYSERCVPMRPEKW